MIVCNVRSQSAQLTGVQRYSRELLARFGNKVLPIHPRSPQHGLSGHFWEQCVLPTKLNNNLLWSPSNTGPLAVEKQVVSVMDLSPMDHPEWMSARFASWYGFLTPRLLRRVRGVLAISEFTKQRIVEYCPEVATKVHVVHLGVDSRFQPASDDAVSEMRKHLGIPSAHYLVALGSLEPRKNLQRLLQAWELIQASIPDEIWLVLAGAKGNKMVFGDVSLAKLPARVYLTGHVPDKYLPALYSGAIASPYLSLYEGFGLPPLEAMACGTSVLTSNITSLPEVVGSAALTVDPYNVEAIAEKLIRLVEDAALRRELTDKGIKQAGHFNWDKTAEQTWRVLQEADQ